MSTTYNPFDDPYGLNQQPDDNSQADPTQAAGASGQTSSAQSTAAAPVTAAAPQQPAGQSQASAPTDASAPLSPTVTTPTSTPLVQPPANATPGQLYAPAGSNDAAIQPNYNSSGLSVNPQYIGSILQSWAGDPNSDPILKTPDGIQYYTQAIINNGGLGQSNLAYWQNKSTLASAGGGVGAPDGGSSGSTGGMDLSSLTSLLGSTLTPPSTAGVFGNSTDPTQQIGQDPLSQQISSALGLLLQNNGGTGSALQKATDDALTTKLQQLGSNQTLAQRLEAVRQPFDAQRTAQVSQLESELADRGLMGTPGAPSGADGTGLGMIEQNMAGSYATGIQQALVAQNTSDLQTIQQATGQSQAEAANLLATANAGTNRQQMLSNIAIASLNQNIQWNEFLATYGLDRAQVIAQIEQGNIASITPLINAFISSAQVQANGQIS